MSNTHPAAIVIPIIAFMSANPDEALSVQDMAVKFGFKARTTPYKALRKLIDEGWVVQEEQPASGRRGRNPGLYAPGPRLLALIGRAG